MAIETCIHDGNPARYLLAMAERGKTYTRPDEVDYEPICGDCRDSYPSTHVTDTCDCDEDHTCAFHSAFCSICERRSDGLEPGPLCKTCRATARNAGGPYTPEGHAAAWRFDRYGMEG